MTRFSGFYRLGLAALAVALVSMTAYAQPRGGGRGGPGGGPGFGFRGPGGGGMLGLLMIPEVREEIDLTEDQVAKLQEARGKLFESMRGQGGGFNPESFRNMTEEEREKAREEMQKRFAEMEKRVNDMLKDILVPAQVQRLEQINLQQQGTQALASQKVINALNITSEQQAELRKIGEEARAQITELFQGFDRNASEEQRAQNREKMDAIRKAAEKKAMGVLSDEQKEALGKLMGKPFEMPERQGRGPGGPGGGDQGGQQGRGPGGGDRGGRGQRGGDRQ